MITIFLRFHINLVKQNKTTIENLEMKSLKTPANKESKTIYDMGLLYNLQQVFGTNKLLWPFPMYMESGKPMGDGVNWATNIITPSQRKSCVNDNEGKEEDEENPEVQDKNKAIQSKNQYNNAQN